MLTKYGVMFNLAYVGTMQSNNRFNLGQKFVTPNGTNSMYMVMPLEHPAGATSISLATSSNLTGIHLGSGTATPTENDTQLGNFIESGLSGTCTLGTVYMDDSDHIVTPLVVGVTNTTDSPITISEIGLTKQVKGPTSATSTSTNNTQSVLVSHDLLPEPITLPPSGSATIVYKFRSKIPIPLASSS